VECDGGCPQFTHPKVPSPAGQISDSLASLRAAIVTLQLAAVSGDCVSQQERVRSDRSGCAQRSEPAGKHACFHRCSARGATSGGVCGLGGRKTISA